MTQERTTFHLPQSSGVAAMILLSFVAVGHAICFGLVMAGAADQVLANRLGAAGVLYAVILLGTVAMTVPAAVTFIVWAVRSRKNLDAFRAVDLNYSSGFPWYFIVPFLNLFVPLLAFQEIWRASDPAPPAQKRRGSVLIYAWWFFFICTGLAGGVPRLLAPADRTAAERGLAAPYHACAVVAACLAVAMIWRLLQRQRRHPRARTEDLLSVQHVVGAGAQ